MILFLDGTLMITSGFLQGQTHQGTGLITESIDLVPSKANNSKCFSSIGNWREQINGATGNILQNNQPVVCGGFKDGGTYLDVCSTFQYLGNAFRWHKKVQMNKERFWASSIVLGNTLWVTGGISHDKETPTTTELV